MSISYIYIVAIERIFEHYHTIEAGNLETINTGLQIPIQQLSQERHCHTINKSERAEIGTISLFGFMYVMYD